MKTMTGRLFGFLCSMVIVFWAIGSLAFANEQFFDADGVSEFWKSMGGDPNVAMEHARKVAMRNASEKAVFFLGSISEVRDGITTQDEIQAISFNKMRLLSEPTYRIEIIDDDIIRYHCHIKVAVDSDDAIQVLRRDWKQRQEIVQLYKLTEAENERLTHELDEYKRKYLTANAEQRKHIVEQTKQNDREFEALQWLEQGSKLLVEQKYDEAIESYIKATALNPQLFKADLGIGIAYTEMKDYEKSAKYIEKATNCLDKATSYESGIVYGYLGYLYEMIGQFDKSLEAFSKAIAFDDNNSVIYSGRASVYFRLGEIEKVIKDCNQALALDPNNDEAYANLGGAYGSIGEYDKAIEFSIQALALNPNKEEAYINLSNIYGRKGEYAKAIDAGNKAIALAPSEAEGYNNLGMVYAMMGDIETALEYYTKAVELEPDLWNAHLGRGMCLQELHRLKEAKIEYAKAYELDQNESTLRKKKESEHW